MDATRLPLTPGPEKHRCKGLYYLCHLSSKNTGGNLFYVSSRRFGSFYNWRDTTALWPIFAYRSWSFLMVWVRDLISRSTHTAMTLRGSTLSHMHQIVCSKCFAPVYIITNTIEKKIQIPKDSINFVKATSPCFTA